MHLHCGRQKPKPGKWIRLCRTGLMKSRLLGLPPQFPSLTMRPGVEMSDVHGLRVARRVERDLRKYKAPMCKGESWREFVAKQTACALSPNKEALGQARDMTATAMAGIEP